ncbi:hypothetical protein PHET_04973 [Paragonimus heterotremus]|uniref:Leucine-rich PPR motif-containing protein, mitochondrial n=1 Tax=Paragonimus heterotremus TaxID=100268 RepID=A0A8J4T0B5_9TREM|nr:hypothetical protein PHET_04973 [Paragonimus heterotremus]
MLSVVARLRARVGRAWMNGIAPLTARRFPSSTVAVSRTTYDNGTRKPGLVSHAEIDRIGISRYLDLHRTSSLLMNHDQKVETFNSLWNFLLSTYIRCVHTPKLFNSAHLQSLKLANLRPDPFIFSRILYGYSKAGCPEEVASTQEIMTRMGLWPSRIGYEGLLSAYAELGDRVGLLNVLNEAWEILPTQSRSIDLNRSGATPFPPSFLINLYVKLLCAEPQADGTCVELLTRLPTPVDALTRSRAREGVKRLLANGRLIGAQELFKRADPETADDPYLSSLPKYMSAGGIDPQSISLFWELSDVSGARLNMLRRQTVIDSRRPPSRTSELHDILRDAFARNDVDAVFNALRDKLSGGSSIIYNFAVPQLLSHGLTAKEVIERIEPPSARSAAAFGCLINSLVQFSKDEKPVAIDLQATETMVKDFIKQGLFPVDDFILLSSGVTRRMLRNATTVPEHSGELPSDQLSHVFDVLALALNMPQLKAVVNQMFEQCLYPFRGGFVMNASGSRRADDAKAIETLVDVCIMKDLKFPRNSWIFYNLENCDIPQAKREQLMLPPFTSPRPTEARTQFPSTWRRLRDFIHEGNIDAAVDVIQKSSSRMDLSQSSTVTSSSNTARFVDPVAIAYEELTRNIDGSQISGTKGSPVISAQDVERLFWASWDGQLLLNPFRAIGQVAFSYTKTSDIKGLAAYFQRASKQLGTMQEVLFAPAFMKPLLEDNFTENLTLLQSMMCHTYLSTSSFASSACLLEDLVSSHSDKLTNPTAWKRGSSEYWPVQVLAHRFKGINHLQKLRTIHNAIDDLCRTSNLYAAHSLRVWTSQLGLLVFPRTNELLLLTPYFIHSPDRHYSLPRWSLSHELSQHWPTTLDSRLLTAFDTLVLTLPVGAKDNQQPSTETVNEVASWLVKHVPSDNVDMDTGALANWLPTWMVICQRLFQSGSSFVTPQAWCTLAAEWINLTVSQNTLRLAQFNHWFTFAPSDKHQAALCLSAVSHPATQSFGLEKLRSQPNLLYTLLMTDGLLTNLSPQQQKHFSDAMFALGVDHCVELGRLLQQSPVPDPDKLKEICSKFTSDELAKHLAVFILAKDALLHPLLQHLKDSQPHVLPALFDQLFDCLRRSPRRLRHTSTCFDAMLQLNLSANSLSPVNQAFLAAALRVLRSSCPELSDPLDHLSTLLPSESREVWLTEARASLSRQDFVGLLELLQKLDPKTRGTVFELLAYSLPGFGDTSRLRKLLLAIAELSNGPLLSLATQTSRPFLPSGLGDAYLAVSDVLCDKKINWLSRACIRFHKLGPLLQPKAQPSAPEASKRQTEVVDELTALIKQPVYSVVQTILRDQSDPTKLTETLNQVTSGWSQQRKTSLVCYLTVEGAVAAVECVVNMSSNLLGTKQAPFVAFAKIISEWRTAGSSTSQPASDIAKQVAQTALKQLRELESRDVAFCLKGPHVETLFRSWPAEQLSELFDLICDVSERERTSLNLQLASIVVNRGRHDLAEKLIKTTGPLPITFLAGSPRHILNSSELNATIAYLRETDPNHLITFVDTCVRNAVSSSSPLQTDNLVNLVRTLASEPHSINLRGACLLPTVNLISDFSRRNPKLPKDVKDLLQSVIDDSNSAAGQKSENEQN